MNRSSPPLLSEADLVALMASSFNPGALYGATGWQGAATLPHDPPEIKDETP